MGCIETHRKFGYTVILVGLIVIWDVLKLWENTGDVPPKERLIVIWDVLKR